jgi:hypothetical protein
VLVNAVIEVNVGRVIVARDVKNGAITEEFVTVA